MAIDTWKIQSDETQKFILRWLELVSDVTRGLLAAELSEARQIAVKLPKDHQAIKMMETQLNQLRTFSAKEVKLDEQYNDVDP